ncbi:MAG: ferrous iron transport protein B [Bacteroidota bacterium]
MDQPTVSSPPKSRVIALVGNPNSGKSSLFNALSGLNQKVGNFPGVTVDRKTALLSRTPTRMTLVDLPGVNSLYPTSEDEHITYQALRDRSHADFPDLVVIVADGTQLKRSLMLATQVIDTGLPAILAINMMDLVEQRRFHIEIKQLAKLLGIPVVPISVRKGTGLKDLKAAMLGDIPEVPTPVMTIPPKFIPVMDEIRAKIPGLSRYHAYQALVGEGLGTDLTETEVEKFRAKIDLTPEGAQRLISNELLVRLDRADSLVEEVLIGPPTEQEAFTEKLDRILTHKVWGYVIFLGILLLIFQSIFAWSGYPMDLIDGFFGAAVDWVKATLPEHWTTDLLADGLIAGLGGVVIFVPQIAYLFLFITLLEESGYMARAVHLMDRIMRPFGFSGRAVIPLMGGMACAIPSIMMARTISNRYERLITIMVTPLMSCSARIPVYTLLIAMFIPEKTLMGFDQRGLFMALIYLLGFVMALLIAFVFKTAFKYNASGTFVMELPAYRMPRWRNVGLVVGRKSWTFVREAGKVIIVISLVLWWLVAYGPQEKIDEIETRYAAQLEQPGLSDDEIAAIEFAQESEKLNNSYVAMMGKTIEPVIRPLGYDWKIGISLITSFAAREVFVGTMSIIYQQQDPEEMEEEEQDAGRIAMIERLRREKRSDGTPVYTPGVVLSLIVFYAIAMQCMSTLAVTRKEVGWMWAGVMLAYLTVLAYVCAFVAYQVVG